MNVGSNGKTLVATTKQLSLKWDETKHYWHDVKTQEFEQRFMSDFFMSVDRSIPIFDDLDKLISRVRNDCE